MTITHNITKNLMQYEFHKPPKEIATHLSLIQRLKRSHTLEGHTGCVNYASWSTDGTLLVSGSDDRRLMIWSVEKDFQHTHTIDTDHICNIFCAEFMNENRSIISGSADGEIRLHNLEGGGQETVGGLLVHSRRDMILKILPDPIDPNNIFWASSKSASIALVDLREAYTKQRGVNIIETPKMLVTTMAFNPLNPYMVAFACADPIIHLWDTRTRTSVQSYGVPELLKTRGQKRSIFNEISTSGISFNNKNQFAVSFCGAEIYLFDAYHNSPDEICTDVVQTYTGHRNVRTFLKDVRFIGLDSEYVASGSDCGNVFIWDTKSADVVQLLDSDISVANGVAAHPTHPALLVSWGIENNIKVWEAISPSPTYVPKLVNKTVENNTAYLESSYMPPNELMRNIATRRQKRRAASSSSTPSSTTTPTSSNENNNNDATTAQESEPFTEGEFRQCVNPHSNPSAIVVARVLRAEGNESFRAQDLNFAYLAYKHAIDVLEGITATTNAQKQIVKNELVPCLLNRAAVALTKKEYAQVLADCTKVISLHDPNNVKAHYRRGMAYFKIGSFEEAMTDLQKAATLDPSDPQTKRAIMDLRKAIEDNKKKEAKMFGGLFK